MNNFRHVLSGVSLLLLFVACGAQCPLQRPVYVPPPKILSDNPSLEELIHVVNANSGKVQSLLSNHATVSVAGLPALRADLAVAGPRRLRLRAGTGLTGEELDLGSNDELFWMWVKRNQPPAVYYCRHDQYERSMARQLMPVRPEWVVSALGVVYLDPAGQHEGPFINSSGHYEVRTLVRDGDRTFRRVTVLERNAGWVLEQHMFTADNLLLASAFTSQHLPDPAVGAVMPRQVRIHWPLTNLEFSIVMHDLRINPQGLEPEASAASPLFQLPNIQGYSQVNLGVAGSSPQGIPQETSPWMPPGGYEADAWRTPR